MQILIYPSTPSTMIEARKMIDKNVAILAIEQTQGIGKPGNTWISTVGNFFLSIVCDKYAFCTTSDISLIFGLAVGESILSLFNNKINLQYKFPNDVYINGKKIAGILTEIYDNRMIIGIGVNLVSSKNEFANLSEYNINIDIYNFYNLLIANLAIQLQNIQFYGIKYIHQKWHERLFYISSSLQN